MQEQIIEKMLHLDLTDGSDGEVEITEEENSVESDNPNVQMNEGSYDSRSKAFENAVT